MSLLLQIIEAAKQINDSPPMDWNHYFMSIAFLASMRSPCKRLRVGSVIVKDHRIISMGYNGFITGASHTSRIRDNHEQAIIHSEINAICDCARRGATLQDAVIYITHYPCINCFRALASCGIKHIYYYLDYNNDSLVPHIADDANISIHKLDPPASVARDHTNAGHPVPQVCSLHTKEEEDDGWRDNSFVLGDL